MEKLGIYWGCIGDAFTLIRFLFPAVETHTNPQVKYILEVFGPNARITTWPGKHKFKYCLIQNCYLTTNESFFGPNSIHKFDALAIKPGNLRADKVIFFGNEPLKTLNGHKMDQKET